MFTAAELKTEILSLVRQYHAIAPGVPGPDAASLAALIEALLDADITGGRHTAKFESGLARLFGSREALLVNSGTSANLVAVSALTSPRMGRLQLKPGDEVITTAAGSPSLVAAIVQNQLVPVFVDQALPAFNADSRQLQNALSSRSRAIAFAHLHGNPFDLDSVTMFAAFNNLLLIEDCRDAAGASFNGRPVGCFGQFATASFHAGRQLSTGQGGAVLSSTPLYRSIAESFRDGGRGDASSGARTHAGYNLRATEMQAAMGVAQVDGLAARLEERARGAQVLLEGLAGLSDQVILPESLPGAKPTWLELPVAVREQPPYKRDRLLSALISAGVDARAFPPKLPSHPAFQQRPHRSVGSLRVTSFTASQGLLLKVPPRRQEAASIVDVFLRTFHGLG